MIEDMNLGLFLKSGFSTIIIYSLLFAFDFDNDNFMWDILNQLL